MLNSYGEILFVYKLLVSVHLSLLLYEGGIIEVVYLHGFAHIMQRLCCSFTGCFASLLQNVVDLWYVLFELMAALTDRFQALVDADTV